MPLTSYIKDLVAPAWNSLTDAQRSAWHFFAEANPIINAVGELDVVNGWMMYVHVNSWLSIASPSFILADPPPDLSTPAPINLRATIWPIKSQLPDSSTWRSGRAFLLVDPPTPSNRIIFILHASEFVSPFSLHPWRVAHSSFIPPGFSGLHDLTTRNGYSLSGSGNLSKLRIVGPWAAHHPQDKVAKLIIVSTTNGMRSRGTLTNSR